MTNDKPRHLGRGLESLLGPMPQTQISSPEETVGVPSLANLPPDVEREEALQELSLDVISPNPYQARTVWNEEDLVELTDSIRANGIIQPIVVRPFQGRYQLIAGERRYRAARMASLERIPALVREVTDEQLFRMVAGGEHSPA